MTQQKIVASETGGNSLWLVAFIVFVDMAGIGLILPVMPSLIVGLEEVSIDRAAEIGGLLLFVYATMQFLFAPIIGGLSDRFGRRPVLLITLAALGLDYLIMAWAPSLIWLFFGRALSGIMGASWAAANSCIADALPPERRGQMFGIMGGAGAAGFVLGPAIGGLLGQFGDRIPFYVAAALALGGAAYGYFRLAETLASENRRRFDWRRANPLGSILQMARSRFVLGCLVAVFFMQLSSQAQLSVWSFYGIAKFGWSTLTIGLTVTLFGVLLGLAQGVLVGPAIQRFGAVRTAKYTLLPGLLSYLILAFAPSTSWMVAGIIVGSITGMTFPAMQSLMTVRVAEDAQGELQGAIASTISLTAIIGPPAMTAIFGAYADSDGLYFPGAPFIASVGLLALGITALWRTLGNGDQPRAS
jgi:DHA1 family tetracycline resistance protein-like MFS transporter